MPPRKPAPKRKTTRTQKSSSRERRAGKRVETKLLTMFREREQGRAVNFVRTLNLSEKGALVESADSMQIGQIVWVEILLDFNRSVNVAAKVAHVYPEANGFIRAGLEFRKMKAEESRLLKEQVKTGK